MTPNRSLKRMVRLFPRVVAAGGLLLALAAPVASQVLTVEPGCGRPGDSFTIGGSGWAEPVPPCTYFFTFDGTQVAAPQPDGLFGPPNAAATVPSVPAGQHTVRVELRIDENGSLVQCRQTPFKVVDQIKDPWDGGNNITKPGGNSVSIGFNPQDVCDITPCSKIVFIQTIQMTGQKSDASTRNLTFAEQGFGNASTLDADVTISGWTVDYITGERDPYYNGDDASDVGTSGVQNGMPRTATMSDGPGRSDGAYPADIVKIILNFEVAAFCASGQNKGEYLGSMTWTWERPKGGTVSVTTSSGSRTGPSANLLDALNKWNMNHGFTLPTTMPPTSGGGPCSSPVMYP